MFSTSICGAQMMFSCLMSLSLGIYFLGALVGGEPL